MLPKAPEEELSALYHEIKYNMLLFKEEGASSPLLLKKLLPTCPFLIPGGLICEC
jgi:hypothetical protein